ncbi:MAG: hypothetical protein COA94_03795 [Rickettsiales bacterium]|nr:MAG: hypothetical protein COA94_03795 [Rickettsiales bacterium]
MLDKIRKGSDSLLVRVLLAIIAFSFVGGGAAVFMGGNSQGDVISFSDTKSISMEDFQAARTREIDALQRQNGINLTDENIEELGINSSILRKLINDSMIKYLARYYDFDISDEKIIDFVKMTPFFKDKNGEFDRAAFKAAFNSPRKEEEYLASIHKHLVTSTLVEVFMSSFNPPKIMTENMVDYMAETRIVDLLSINLGSKPAGYKAPNLSDEQLEDFYKKNQDQFVVPELRSFDYIKVDRKFLSKKLKISAKELRKYFNENKEEFSSKHYAKVKKEVKELVSKAKLDELSSELVKNLEEDASGGFTLKEIAKKYALKVKNVRGKSFDELSSGKVKDHAELVDNIFEMSEGEVSSPIERSDNNEILMVALNSIAAQRQQEFVEVRKEIKKFLLKRELAFANVKKLEAIQKTYSPKKINRKKLKSNSITTLVNKSLTRADLPLEKKLPANLLKGIFGAQKNTVTALVGDGKKVYFAYVKKVTRSNAKAKKIRKTSSSHFADTIKEGLFNELIVFMTKKNKMKITGASEE